MIFDDKSYKDSFENIEVPKEADFVIEKAIKRAKNRYKRRFLKLSSGIAASFALLLFLSKASPAFAEYINDATAPVKNLFIHLGDKGLNNAAKNGFIQASKDKKASSLSASDKGITVTIDQVAISGDKLDIGYTLKADDKYKDFKDLYYDKFRITDNKGKVLYDSESGEFYYNGFDDRPIYKKNFKDTRVKQGVFGFTSIPNGDDSRDLGKCKIPDSINIEFYDFSDTEWLCTYRNSKNHPNKSPKVVEGKWAISIKISDKFKNIKGIKYVKAKETEKNSDIKIEYINVYPTTANAKFSYSRDMSISNLYLEDEKGNKYIATTGMVEDFPKYTEAKPYFESPYFNKVKKLYLVFDAKENGKNKNFRIELKKQ